jgi:hypothetical protein
MAQIELTAARLRERLSYDADTGEFKWIVRGSRIRVGMVAGYECAKGYRKIEVDGQAYMAHRLAWLHMNGEWPAHEIDHINSNRGDNKACNLRTLPHAENCQNKRKARSDSKSGIQGVSKVGNSFKAEITVHGAYYFLGHFASTAEASNAYQFAKAKLHVSGGGA